LAVLFLPASGLLGASGDNLHVNFLPILRALECLKA